MKNSKATLRGTPVDPGYDLHGSVGMLGVLFIAKVTPDVIQELPNQAEAEIVVARRVRAAVVERNPCSLLEQRGEDPVLGFYRPTADANPILFLSLGAIRGLMGAHVGGGRREYEHPPTVHFAHIHQRHVGRLDAIAVFADLPLRSVDDGGIHAHAGSDCNTTLLSHTQDHIAPIEVLQIVRKGAEGFDDLVSGNGRVPGRLKLQARGLDSAAQDLFDADRQMRFHTPGTLFWARKVR